MKLTWTWLSGYCEKSELVILENAVPLDIVKEAQTAYFDAIRRGRRRKVRHANEMPFLHHQFITNPFALQVIEAAMGKKVALFLDGGFGNCLEPDIRTSASSAIATTVGFQILREIRAPAEHALVRKGSEYFVATFDESRGVWPIIPPEVEEAPHAPWWNYEDSAENFGQFLTNPRAEIVGYLHEFSDGVSTQLLKQLTATVLEHLNSLPDEMDMHDILCFVKLAETEALSNRDKVWEKLTRTAALCIARNAEQLTGYVLKPLWLVSSPESPLATEFKDEVEMNLDFEIGQQGEDGAWPPNFSWGGQYPEAWQIAKKEWQSRFTVDTLKTLRDFGRIEQVDR